MLGLVGFASLFAVGWLALAPRPETVPVDDTSVCWLTTLDPSTRQLRAWTALAPACWVAGLAAFEVGASPDVVAALGLVPFVGGLLAATSAQLRIASVVRASEPAERWSLAWTAGAAATLAVAASVCWHAGGALLT